jgi:hypothetical protein
VDGDRTPGRPLDFFISHAGTDEEWATWIAQQLENAGYTVELDVWSWAAGMDVIEATQRAMDHAARVLAVWSPDYFTRLWAQLEHRVTFAAAQTRPGWLLPVVVHACAEEMIPVLYRTLIRVDLVDLGESEARARLLKAVAGPRRPTARLPYPGSQAGSYPGRLPPVWNVPNRNPFFTGRQAILDEMHALLSKPDAAVALVAERAEAGTGKSGLAVEYAWRHAGEAGLVWWVDAGSPGTGEASLTELAVLLGVPVGGGAATALPALFATLADRTDWLLVLDDVASDDQLGRLRPPPSGRLIVTSRDSGLGPLDQRIEVGRFRRAESENLLRRRCPWLAPPAVARIAAIVDDLPVAVAQAAAFLAQTGMRADEYLPRLAERAGPGGPLGGAAGLAATVAVGLERLAMVDPAAADLLDQLALLAPEPVPLTAATPDAAPAPGLVVSDPETTSEIVSAITGLGLATRDGTTLQLHSRVHAVIAGSMTGQRRVLALGRALRLLATADPGDPGQTACWPRYAALTPHVRAVAAILASTPGVTETGPFQQLLDHVCGYLSLAGQPGTGHALAAATHRRRQLAYGADHPETLRWAVHVGMSLGSQGRHEVARKILADAYRRQRQVAGPDHPDTLHTAECLGVTLAALGDDDGAQRVLLDTLTRRQRTLGPDAAETLQSASDLGAVLASLTYHEQARQVLEDALAGRRRTLGPNHPDTLTTAHHLGRTLAATGDHHAARNVLQDTATRRRNTLGPDHPDTLTTAHHLGRTLAATGDHHAARNVLDDTLRRRQQVLGRDHPDTLDTEASRREPWSPAKPCQQLAALPPVGDDACC